MDTRLCRLGGSLGALAFLPGCVHRSGSSSVQFVDSGHPAPAVDAAKMDVTKPIDVFVQAVPLPPLAEPTYPADALRAKLPATTIAVTLRIGAEGRVEGITPSTAALRIPTPFDAQFDRAIREAVAHWRFEPAKTAKLIPSNEGPMVMDAADTESSLDVFFEFSQTGKVAHRVPK